MRPGPRGSERARHGARHRVPAAARAVGVRRCGPPRAPSRGRRGADGPNLRSRRRRSARSTSPARGNESLDDSGWGRVDQSPERPLSTAGPGRPGSASTRPSSGRGPRTSTPTSPGSTTPCTPPSSGSRTRRPGSRSRRATRTCSSGGVSRSRCARSTSSGSTRPSAASRCRMQRDPFAVTAVAGFANPARVDEYSGRSLFPRPTNRPAVPIFGIGPRRRRRDRRPGAGCR